MVVDTFIPNDTCMSHEAGRVQVSHSCISLIHYSSVLNSLALPGCHKPCELQQDALLVDHPLQVESFYHVIPVKHVLAAGEDVYICLNAIVNGALLGSNVDVLQYQTLPAPALRSAAALQLPAADNFAGLTDESCSDHRVVTPLRCALQSIPRPSWSSRYHCNVTLHPVMLPCLRAVGDHWPQLERQELLCQAGRPHSLSGPCGRLCPSRRGGGGVDRQNLHPHSHPGVGQHPPEQLYGRPQPAGGHAEAVHRQVGVFGGGACSGDVVGGCHGTLPPQESEHHTPPCFTNLSGCPYHAAGPCASSMNLARARLQQMASGCCVPP